MANYKARAGKSPLLQLYNPTGWSGFTSVQSNPLSFKAETMELTNLSEAQMYLVVESKVALTGSS